MDRNRQFCRSCEAVDVLPFDEHVMTKRHQLCVHKKEFSIYRASHGIYVNNLPPSVPKEEIVSFFAQYGTILSSMISDKNVYGIFEYKEKQVVSDLIAAKRVDFQGRIISVRARNPKPDNNFANEDPPKVNPDEAIHLLRSQTDIVSEIRALHGYLQPVSRDVFYAALCMDLKGVLSQYMNCMVYPFGSTVTGLDFSTSDVDAYVLVDPRDRICGKFTGDALARRLVEVIPPFLAASQLFAKVVSIPNANTPIVKCVHLRTGISCDINFKNMLGVCNSYLIKRYLSYNSRLNIALVIIKYWAKVHNLTGVGKFSNYAITVLFLFRFMQEPYNLPSVYTLQRNHHSNEQDGWDAGFEFGDFAVSNALSRLGVVELLTLFFKFYANYEYSDVVLCPFIGRSLERSAFVEGGELPVEYSRYKKRLATNGLYPTTPLCVQDCFELCRNITRAVRLQEFDEFVQLCKEGQTGLNSVHLYPIFYDSCYSDDDTFQFVLMETHKFKTHLGMTHNCLNNPRDSNEHFQDFVRTFMNRLLTQVYLLEVLVETPVNSGQVSGSPPTKLQKKSTHDFSVVFDCESHIDVWTSRSIIMKDHSKLKDEDVFDAEVRLSDYIANTLCRKIKTRQPLVKFKLSLVKDSEHERDVKVVIANKGANLYAYKDFSMIFIKFVRNFYHRYISSLIDKSTKTSEVDEKKE